MLVEEGTLVTSCVMRKTLTRNVLDRRIAELAAAG